MIKEWSNYNGDDFTNGVFDNSKVYNQINNKYNTNFVNSYAQTNRDEDIASTFEDIMSNAYNQLDVMMLVLQYIIKWY